MDHGSRIPRSEFSCSIDAIVERLYSVAVPEELGRQSGSKKLLQDVSLVCLHGHQHHSRINHENEITASKIRRT